MSSSPRACVDLQQGAGGDTFIGPLTLAAALRACTGQRYVTLLYCSMALALFWSVSYMQSWVSYSYALHVQWFAKRLTLWWALASTGTRETLSALFDLRVSRTLQKSYPCCVYFKVAGEDILSCMFLILCDHIVQAIMWDERAAPTVVVPKASVSLTMSVEVCVPLKLCLWTITGFVATAGGLSS